MTYELPVPPDRLTVVAQAIDALLEQPEIWMERPDRAVKIDVRANLEHLALDGGRLIMSFRAGREAAARPRDVLQLLGLGDIENSGVFLTRTRVELA